MKPLLRPMGHKVGEGGVQSNVRKKINHSVGNKTFLQTLSKSIAGNFKMRCFADKRNEERHFQTIAAVNTSASFTMLRFLLCFALTNLCFIVVLSYHPT